MASDGSGMQSSSKMESFQATSAHIMQSDPTDYREVKHDITYADLDVGQSDGPRKPPNVQKVNYSAPAFNGQNKNKQY